MNTDTFLSSSKEFSYKQHDTKNVCTKAHFLKQRGRFYLFICELYNFLN